MAREGYRTVMLTAAVGTNFPGERAAFPTERADKLVKDGHAKDADADDEPEPDIVVPDGWRDLPAADKRDLAAKIDGTRPPNADDAEVIIETYLETLD